MIFYLIFGIVLLLGSAAFIFFYYRKNHASMIEVQYMKSTSIKDCVELLDEMGEGSSHYAELHAGIDTALPLNSPIENKSCIAYASKIDAEYKETSEYKKPDGTTGSRVSITKRSIFNQSKESPMYFTDSSSDVKIQIGADYRAADLLSKENCQYLLPSTPRAQDLIRDYNIDQRNLSRIIMQERVLLCGGSAYALGDVKKEGDFYTFKKPIDKKKYAALSLGTESSYLSVMKKKTTKTLLLAGLVGLAGILLIVLSFF